MKHLKKTWKSSVNNTIYSNLVYQSMWFCFYWFSKNSSSLYFLKILNWKLSVFISLVSEENKEITVLNQSIERHRKCVISLNLICETEEGRYTKTISCFLFLLKENKGHSNDNDMCFSCLLNSACGHLD